MKKILLGTAIIGLFVASFITVKLLQKKRSQAKYSIGILQTASHPALDAARDGFIESLQAKLGHDVAFTIQNAQGSISQAHAIAQQFHATKEYDAFFAIATPAAQALSTVEKDRPIVIAAVTDPNALGLVHPDTNVAGTQDMIDVQSEIEMMTKLVPNITTVGLLYTAGEMNSLVLIQKMHAVLDEIGLKYIDFAVNTEADMQTVVEAACRKVDVVLAPTDNTVASTIGLISSIALKYKKPLIVSDNMLVASGALASKGVNYHQSGKQAGNIALEIIAGDKKPFELPIAQAESEQIYVNKEVLDLLGLVVPESLQHNIVLV